MGHLSKSRFQSWGIERKTLAEITDSLQAARLNGVIFRVLKAISDHISYLMESLLVEATGG